MRRPPLHRSDSPSATGATGPRRSALLGALASGLAAVQCFAPPPPPPAGAAIAGWPLAEGALLQTDDDETVTYSLLAPGTGEFHVRYEVSATTPGATSYFNILRKGSGVRDMRAIDLYSGRDLPAEVVPGTDARENGHPAARPDVDYLRIDLARPVPDGGQARLAIEKVYGDPRGYFLDDEVPDGRIVFARVMNIRRNAVVMPPDYELIQCNHPTLVSSEDDGRVRVSFVKTGQSPVFLVLRARPLPGAALPDEQELGPAAESVARNASALEPARAVELIARAPDRELLIDLGDPRRGAFRAVHDFTEAEPGRATRAVTPAPPGSVFRATATVLDTGETLTTHVERRSPDGERADVVTVDLPTVEDGCSARLRVEELRIDPSCYRIEDGELVWRAHADDALRHLMLPAGWYLTGNDVPASVVELPDGRIRLDFAAAGRAPQEWTVRARFRPEPPPVEPTPAEAPGK